MWKLEAIGRDTRSVSFAAAVAGFEYSFYGVRDSAADIGTLLEVLHDSRSAVAPPTVFDNDIFVGTRIALNDASDTSVLAGIAIDSKIRETFLNVEAERRIGAKLSVELRLRALKNTEPGESPCAFERDDYLQLRLSWYY